METDNRSKYVWTIVLITNIEIVLSYILVSINETLKYNYADKYQSILEHIISPEVAYVALISISLTTIPVLISKSTNKLVRRLGYGIPILLLLPMPYFIYDYYTCTGKFCQLGTFILVFCCGLVALFTSIFYTLGIKVTKWSKNVFLSIMIIEVMLFIIGLISLYSGIIKVL